MSMFLSTAIDLINIKKTRNIIMIEILKLQNSILELELEIKSKALKINNNKINIIKTINLIEDAQKNHYSHERENAIAALTNEVNNSTLDLTEFYTTMDAKKKNYTYLLKKLRELDKKIPDTAIITNFKISQVGSDTCHNPKLPQGN